MWSPGKKLARAAQLLARGQLRIAYDDESDGEPEEVISAALAALGLEVEEPLELEEEFALWPECVPTFQFWQAVQTQWRIGMTGRATGLDYQGVKACMELCGIPRKKRTELFAGIRAMERATLNEWAAQD